MLQYNLINSSVNLMYVNFMLYIVFGRNIFIIGIFYICLSGECGVWQTFHWDILCYRVLVFGNFVWVYNYVYVVFL
jgi:hypothetical protein